MEAIQTVTMTVTCAGCWQSKNTAKPAKDDTIYDVLLHTIQENAA